MIWPPTIVVWASQMASLLVHPFLEGSLLWPTDIDRERDKPRYMCEECYTLRCSLKKWNLAAEEHICHVLCCPQSRQFPPRRRWHCSLCWSRGLRTGSGQICWTCRVFPLAQTDKHCQTASADLQHGPANNTVSTAQNKAVTHRRLCPSLQSAGTVFIRCQCKTVWTHWKFVTTSSSHSFNKHRDTFRVIVQFTPWAS